MIVVVCNIMSMRNTMHECCVLCVLRVACCVLRVRVCVVLSNMMIYDGGRQGERAMKAYPLQGQADTQAVL